MIARAIYSPFVICLTLIGLATILEAATPSIARGQSHEKSAGVSAVAAIKAARREVAVAPRSASAHVRLGQALSEADRVKEALAEFREAFRLDGTLKAAVYGIGSSLRALDRNAEALVYLRKALNIAPGDGDTLWEYGIVLTNLGQYDNANAAYKLAVAKIPDSAALRGNQAEPLMKQSKWADAIVVLLEAVRLDPRDSFTQSQLGYCYWHSSDWEKAVATYSQAVKLGERSFNTYYMRGVALLNLHRYDESLADLAQASKIDPTNARGHNALASLYLDTHKLELAESSIKKALAIRPNEPEFLTNEGALRLEQGRPDEALISYRKAAAIQPANVFAHCGSGMAYRDLKRYSEAEAEFKTCIRLRTFAPDHIELGWIYYDLARIAEARAEFNKAISLDGKSKHAYYGLGSAQYAAKDTEAAMSALREAIKIDPDYAEARWVLGKILNELGKRDDAIAEVTALRRINSKLADDLMAAIK